MSAGEELDKRMNAAIDAARAEAYTQGISDPFMAHVADHPNAASLERADLEAEKQNLAAWHLVLQAAMEAYGEDCCCGACGL